MRISFDTLVLARKYTDEKVISVSSDVINEAVTQAVAQSKTYTDQEVSKILSFDIEVVATLPIEPNNHTIYLIPKTLSSQNNGYYEYIYTNSGWELIGDTEIDLSGYYKKEEVDQLIEDNKYVLPVATADILGGVKIDGEVIKLNEDGTITLDTQGTAEVIDEIIQPIDNNDIASLFD